MAEGPRAEERACSTRLHRLFLRVPQATLDILGAYGEALFRAIFGLELDSGKARRRKSLGTGVDQPEDPWEVRDRLLEALPTTRGVSVTAGGLKRCGRLEKAEERACSTLRHRLVLRVPKATLDILGAYGEVLFRAIFGVELDGGKLRRKSLGTGVYQPEVRDRLLEALPTTRGQAPKPFPGPLAADACAAALAPKPVARAWPRRELSPSSFLWVSKVTLGSPASNPPRQPAGPLARLQSPFGDLWLQMPAPQPWLPKPGRAWPR